MTITMTMTMTLHTDLLSLDPGHEDLLGDAGIHGFGQLEVDPKLDHNHHHDP